MAHQCLLQIDNSKNPYDLTLQSVSDPDNRKPKADGTFSNVNPSSTAITVGAMVPAGDTLSFELTGGDIDTAGALLTWSTGDGSNNTEATITMLFENNVLGNKVSLNVAPSGSDSVLAKLAYGVSYFYAAEGNGSLSRDALNTRGPGNAKLSHSPVTAHFIVAYNALATQPAAQPSMNGITNVVMLMLENRGFDHLLGMLYSSDPKVVSPAGSVPPAENSTVPNPINFDGLANNPGFSNTTADLGEVAISPVNGNLQVPAEDPGEQWIDANQQLFNTPPPSTSPPPPTGTPGMEGFMANYEVQPSVEKASKSDSNFAKQIMQYYTSKDLPVLSALAENYAVSDRWFCSVPSQTSPNRAFSLAGTSDGFVDNYDIEGIHGLHSVVFKSSTLFNVLENCGMDDWRIYYEQSLLGHSLTETLFEQLHTYRKTDHVAEISQFYSDLENNTLPAFTYLEPSWGGSKANDYHPPYNLCPGEQNLAKVYDALTKYENWDTTLFIVTFDEHGGTFDHAAPPSTVAPDGMTDWSGFAFDRLGVRVPTILVSPRIQQGMVFRSDDVQGTPFDHTSFLKTLMAWQNIDISGGVLGARAAVAPDFSSALSSSVVNPNPVKLEPPVCLPTSKDPAINELEKLLFLQVALELTGAEIGSKELSIVLEAMMAMKTMEELEEYIKKHRKA